MVEVVSVSVVEVEYELDVEEVRGFVEVISVSVVEV